MKNPEIQRQRKKAKKEPKIKKLDSNYIFSHHYGKMCDNLFFHSHDKLLAEGTRHVTQSDVASRQDSYLRLDRTRRVRISCLSSAPTATFHFFRFVHILSVCITVEWITMFPGDRSGQEEVFHYRNVQFDSFLYDVRLIIAFEATCNRKICFSAFACNVDDLCM